MKKLSSAHKLVSIVLMLVLSAASAYLLHHNYEHQIQDSHHCELCVNFKNISDDFISSPLHTVASCPTVAAISETQCITKAILLVCVNCRGPPVTPLS